MRFPSFIITGFVSTTVIVGAASASNIKDPYKELECPKLSLEQAVEIVKSGKMIDAIPHYVAFAQRTKPSSDITQVKSIDTKAPYEDSDGNVFCNYELSDAQKNAVFELSLRPNYGVTEEPAER